jgi:hypothetical protein
MNEQVIRNCVLTDRLARHLADYYYRRVCGMRCPDLLPPEERARAESRYDQRLQGARLFVRGSRTHAGCLQVKALRKDSETTRPSGLVR